MFAHSDGIPERVRRVAEELGVGVVTFSNPNAASLYDHPTRKERAHQAILAKRRTVTTTAREEFIARTKLTDPG